MAIVISGTTGISGVDGSASTPALQGTDTNTGVFFGADTVTIATGGTAAVTVDSGQRTKFPTTIGVGGATPSTSGSGITFPATQSASSDANTLDDYEEGTWTPADASGAGLSFSSVTGRYTKIGRFVIATGTVTYPSTANGNTALISGLPFAPGGNGWHSGSVGYSQYTTAHTLDTGDSNTNIYMYAFGGTGVTNANLSTKRIDFAAYYQTS